MQVKGVEWQRVDGTLKKFLIRFDPITRRPFREPVLWVQTDNPYCALCLSDKVAYDHGDASWRCEACGLASDPPSVTN